MTTKIKICTHLKCNRPTHARGLCQPHYRLWYRRAIRTPPSYPVEETLEALAKKSLLMEKENETKPLRIPLLLNRSEAHSLYRLGNGNASEGLRRVLRWYRLRNNPTTRTRSTDAFNPPASSPFTTSDNHDLMAPEVNEKVATDESPSISKRKPGRSTLRLVFSSRFPNPKRSN